MEKIYGDPKKLLSFIKAGNLASIQLNLKGATSLHRKKLMKPKLEPLKLKINIILYKNAKKHGRIVQSKLNVGYFLL